MKKILLLAAAIGLLAAGCSGSQSTSMGTSPTGVQQSAMASPTAMQQPSPTVTAQMQTQASADVSSSNPANAANLIINDSTKEQSSVGTSDDSDLTNSDSSSLNSFTGVSNGY